MCGGGKEIVSRCGLGACQVGMCADFAAFRTAYIILAWWAISKISSSTKISKERSWVSVS